MSLQTFIEPNANIAPFTSLLTKRSATRSPHQGGPIWQDWEECIAQRYCTDQQPRDTKPLMDGFSAATPRIATGFWYGPAINHFGHQLADFSTRVPAYLGNIDETNKLILGTLGDRPTRFVEVFLKQILAWYEIPMDHVLVCNSPLVVDRLTWAPQHEQRMDVPPSQDYLNVLTLHARKNLAYPMKRYRVYVSRAGFNSGIVAGESYIEHYLENQGFRVVRPESISLREQLTYYQNAPLIVFSEGSSIHALQLLGALDCIVVIVVRRHKRQLAKRIISSRVKQLHYLDCIQGFANGIAKDGERTNSRSGITIINQREFLGELEKLGVGTTEWNTEHYSEAARRDVEKWLSHEQRRIGNSLPAAYYKDASTRVDLMRYIKDSC